MKLSFRYADRTVRYAIDSQGALDREILAAKHVPRGGEFVIDLRQTRPSEIKRYRKFVRKNEELCTGVFNGEMTVHVSEHVAGNPVAKREARSLFRMQTALMQMGKPPGFEQYFAGLMEMYSEAFKKFHAKQTKKHAGDARIVSFDFGDYKSRYVVDEETGDATGHMTNDKSCGKNEFVLDVDETDPAKLKEYAGFISKNRDLYWYLFEQEMCNYADRHMSESPKAWANAKRLFELNQRFEETELAVDFATCYQRYVSHMGRMEDAGNENLTRVSFGYAHERTQYVAEKGASRHKTYHVILDEPPEPGELIIKLDETDPAKIEEYRRFVDGNQDLYAGMFANEMQILILTYATGTTVSRELAQELFHMHARITGLPESQFGEFFDKQVEIVKREMPRGFQDAVRRELGGG